MARTRVKLAYITNDATRKATYKKRKKGLVNSPQSVTLKLVLLSTLLHEMHAIEQSNRTVTQESLVRKRIEKVEEQLKRLREKNRRKELTQVMYQNLGGNGNTEGGLE
ncbi:hypothetical protein V6N13_018751 [Hibiscus sabdariffa]|uniref:MADS-box domain-containing protein n=1 Tax=Hibiscus sabdariffa TaxID=183260 RepID=A0ABR2EKZ6_9ROSI